MARQKEPTGHAAAAQEPCCAIVVPYWPAEEVQAEGAVTPAAQKKCGGHGTCVVLAVEGEGQKEPGEQRFASDAALVPAALKQEPAAHAVQTETVPPALK